MNHKKFLIVLSLVTISLSGCKKSEPVEQPVTTEVVETTNIETEIEENADRGAAVGEVVDNTESTETNNPYADYGKTDESLADYEVTITEELNTQMYVIKASDIKKLDQEKAGSIAPAEFGVPLEVTGKTSNGWYEVVWATTKGYLPAEVLSDTNPNPEPDMNEVITEDGRTTEEVLEDFWELMGEGYNDGTGGISQDALDNPINGPESYNKAASTDW